MFTVKPWPCVTLSSDVCVLKNTLFIKHTWLIFLNEWLSSFKSMGKRQPMSDITVWSKYKNIRASLKNRLLIFATGRGQSTQKYQLTQREVKRFKIKRLTDNWNYMIASLFTMLVLFFSLVICELLKKYELPYRHLSISTNISNKSLVHLLTIEKYIRRKSA